MSRTAWALARLVTGVGILTVLVVAMGARPFLDGLAAVSVGSLGVAAGIAVVTTVSSAWRWSLVARGLGVEVRLGRAVGAYYRSQFLNTVLPGGVLGDVHRAVDHGRDVGDVGRGLRAVAWERSAGQVVQVAITLVVLLTLASPVRFPVPVTLAATVAGVVAAVLAIRAMPTRGSSRWARMFRAAAGDLREGLLSRRSWPGIALASVIVVAGHTSTFLVAARAAGVSAPLQQLLPLAMLIMLAMTVPANVGGWGPREGAAAWLFGAAGLGAAQGISVASLYGVMALVATLPGAAVLVSAWVRREPRPLPAAPGARQPSPLLLGEVAAAAVVLPPAMPSTEVAAHG